MLPFPRHRRLVAALIFAGLASAPPLGPAWASGRLPPMPMPAQHFASFQACLEHLDAVQRTDKASADAAAIADGENRTRQKLVDGGGIERTGAQSARYRVRVGNQFRVTDRRKGVIETTFSYEETELECHDHVLTGSVTSGYMLPGIEQLPEASKP